MWKLLGLAIAIALCILFISACVPAPTPTPAPAPTEAPPAVVPTHTPVPAPTPIPSAPITYPQPAEVILAGLSKSIPTVVAVALDEQIGLTRIGEPVGLGALDEKLQDWTMELYGVSDKSKPAGEGNDWARVGDVVSIAYKLEILADPNYLVAADANPTPQVVFSPHHGGGSPYGGPNPGGTFEQQWAFGALPGIGPLDTATCKGATEVFVFDTQPQNDYGLFTVAPDPIPTPAPAPGATPCSPSSHGLFVSGLIKHVAPEAQVELSPVLDGCGVGTLWGIDVALVQVVLKKLAQPAPSVLNLSLGVQAVEPSGFSSPAGKEIAQKACVRFWEDPNWPQVDVQDLCWFDTLLYLFRQTGGVVVAAAGNDSWVDPKNPEQMELPAAYPAVIGVAGSNMAGARSCFSNFGKLSDSANPDLWVSAPAGEGATIGATPCAPAASLCLTPAPDPNCPYAVVGPIDTGASGPGYAYWSGTSFAAPLVSGLAACVLPSCSSCSGSSAATAVFERIECGASPKPTGTPDPASPGRVINVPKALSSCP